MKRVILFVCVLVIVSVGALWFADRQRAISSKDASLVSVTATFYPLAEAARRIGGAYARVSTLTPPGAEPHDYEPTPGDIAAINGGIFLLNGGVDAWAERLLPDLRTRGALVVRVADRLPEIGKDPHVWLDPVRAQTIAALVLDALVKTDPAHADDYRRNADAYLRDLTALDSAYAAGLKTCGIRAVVTSHDALGYVAARYGFKVVPIAGLNPEEEPSPRQMAEIAETARKAGVKYVFFETLMSPKLAQTIASEVGAETAVFDPIEGLSEKAIASGKEYVSVMRENLAALRKAMVCR